MQIKTRGQQQSCEIKIADRCVGSFERTLVVAEIGVNHDGSAGRARELIDLAAACGADAVKLQLFSADRLMHRSSQFAQYQQKQVTDTDPAAMLRRYELSRGDVVDLVKLIRKRGLLPLATPFAPADVPFIAELKLPAVKIASPDLVNRPLLAAAHSLGVPMIVSTGASTLEEIFVTAEWFAEWNQPFSLLHCISCYPAPDDQINLCWISELADLFGVPVGYSDHGTDVSAGALAVAAGAAVIEKHFTYDRTAKGPDHAASADPDQFARYVKAVRRAETLRGKPGKRVLDIEQDVRRVSRQSLVTTRDLAAGERLTNADLTVQRPGTGISGAEIGLAIGRKVAGPLKQGTMLQWEMLAA